jgi:hypothetical protein
MSLGTRPTGIAPLNQGNESFRLSTLTLSLRLRQMRPQQDPDHHLQLESR